MSVSIEPGKRIFESNDLLVTQNQDGGSRWFYIPQPVVRPRLRLYCFPYAAGSPALFRDWTVLLPGTVEMRAVTLPGRGLQADARPICNLKVLSGHIAKAVAAHSDTHFAFFGHSMGALLAFETTRELRRRGSMQPVHLFLSACHAAHRFSENRATVENMTNEEFITHLGRLAGTPREILNDRQLMEILLPSLKADFLALDRWRYEADRPLNVPITAIAGRDDEAVGTEAVREWQQHTNMDFNFTAVAGDHFFVTSAPEPLVELISRTLRNDAWL
ncbi:MAG TPA: thioesterase domain-containing protein [Gammaproteobacteria bacterium]